VCVMACLSGQQYQSALIIQSGAASRAVSRCSDGWSALSGPREGA
jgi:hypothetical protein